MPLTDRLGARLKVDKQVQSEGLDKEAGERISITGWGRELDLSSAASTAVRTTLQSYPTKKRATVRYGGPVAVRLPCAMDDLWFQSEMTVQTSGNREKNDRIGAAQLAFNDRFNILGEVSDGDLGTGGRLD
jgi:hypothetical protein